MFLERLNPDPIKSRNPLKPFVPAKWKVTDAMLVTAADGVLPRPTNGDLPRPASATALDP
jgi:hypothetical protein